MVPCLLRDRENDLLRKNMECFAVYLSSWSCEGSREDCGRGREGTIFNFLEMACYSNTKNMQGLFCSVLFLVMVISSAQEYSNRWTVQIEGEKNDFEASRLARKYGFVNHGKVRVIIYHFLLVFYTVQPRYNEPQYNEVLSIMIYFLYSSNTVEPRCNEGPRDWQSMFAITRLRNVAVLFHIFYYYWG